MKDLTKDLMRKLYIKTGISAKSACLNQGSISHLVTFTLPYRKDIEEFCSTENFSIKGKRVIYGLKVEYIGSIFNVLYHKNHGYKIDVRISELSDI